MVVHHPEVGMKVGISGSAQVFPQRFIWASLKRRMGLGSNVVHSVHWIQSKWTNNCIVSIMIEGPRIFLRIFIQ